MLLIVASGVSMCGRDCWGYGLWECWYTTSGNCPSTFFSLSIFIKIPSSTPEISFPSAPELTVVIFMLQDSVAGMFFLLLILLSKTDHQHQIHLIAI